MTLVNRNKYWCKNNQLIIMINDIEKKYWYKNTQLHRDNDKPAIISYNGDKFWYINDKCYRMLGYSDKCLYYKGLSYDYYRWRIKSKKLKNGNSLRIIRMYINKL